MKKPKFGFALSKSAAADWARDVVRSMSIDERIGQLISARAHSPYKSSDDPGYAELFDHVDRHHVGGFIFFQGEVFGQAILASELEERSKYPLLFSQDAEWGVGMRLFETTTFPNMMAVGASGNPDHAYTVGRVTAIESKTLGVKWVFAPVGDLNNNSANPIINVRAFGEDHGDVSEFVKAAIRGLQDGGVLATVKHFPGHGDTAVDSHAALPVLDVDRTRLDSLELVPFRAAIEAGVESVMVGHLALPALDPTGVPASLSKPICTDLLRNELGFDGMIVSDAMDMNGIQLMFDADEAAYRGVDAGLDMILCPPDVAAAFHGIRSAVDAGQLTEERISESAVRVLTAKALVGLTTRQEYPTNAIRAVVASKEHLDAAAQVARASITIVRDELSSLDAKAPLLHVVLSDTSDKETVGRQLRNAVMSWNSSSQCAEIVLSASPSEEEFAAAIELVNSFGRILVSAFVAVRSFSGKIGLPAKHQVLINRMMASGKEVILASLGSPYVVMGLDVQPQKIVFGYGASAATQFAMADVLLNGKAAPGRLPVSIPGLYERGAGLR